MTPDDELLPLLARAAATVELELMLDIRETTLGLDLLLKVLDRACDVENLNRTAVAADEIVLMIALAETIVRRTAVKTDPADNSLFFQTSHQPIQRRRVTRDVELRIGRDLLQGDRLVCIHENSQTGLQRRSFPKA